jgi:hypothetical protein
LFWPIFIVQAADALLAVFGQREQFQAAAGAAREPLVELDSGETEVANLRLLSPSGQSPSQHASPLQWQWPTDQALGEIDLLEDVALLEAAS